MQGVLEQMAYGRLVTGGVPLRDLPLKADIEVAHHGAHKPMKWFRAVSVIRRRKAMAFRIHSLYPPVPLPAAH